MIIHVDPVTGSPIFVMDQIMMVEGIRNVYNKYGIHGIYYAVLFGWVASPYAMITKEEERHEMVTQEVYGKSFYDPIIKEEVLREKLQSKDQYKRADMAIAVALINRLARVPILEDKNAYLRWLDENTIQMNVRPNNAATPAGIEAHSKLQKQLIANRKDLTSNLDAAMEREKNMLTQKDRFCSLDDFIVDILPNVNL